MLLVILYFLVVSITHRLEERRRDQAGLRGILWIWDIDCNSRSVVEVRPKPRVWKKEIVTQDCLPSQGGGGGKTTGSSMSTRDWKSFGTGIRRGRNMAEEGYGPTNRNTTSLGTS